ncbi:hypothetical protein JNUCC42_01775 [Brevibacterium sp. JNUCC-42]|nr:hypothetical protein JNUCC42_01775 [Brevibacterium sp. JNUCC-42]
MHNNRYRLEYPLKDETLIINTLNGAIDIIPNENSEAEEEELLKQAMVFARKTQVMLPDLYLQFSLSLLF